MIKNKDDKCFQYRVTIALNHEAITWNPEKVLSIKPFGKHLGKIIRQLFSIFCILNKKKYVPLISLTFIRIVKNK